MSTISISNIPVLDIYFLLIYFSTSLVYIYIYICIYYLYNTFNLFSQILV